MPPSANITGQPGGVNSALAITRMINAGKEAFQTVNPIHTPNETAIPFPPRNPRKGEKTCPRRGRDGDQEHRQAAQFQNVICHSNRKCAFTDIQDQRQ